jgi:hypothetical protein
VPELLPLTAPGRRRADYPLREKVAANRALLEASHALPLVATVQLRTAALHSDEARGSMQLAQAAKEEMHAPVFSLAASAAVTAATKSEGTNPIPQPDTWPRCRHAFFKTNPISRLAQNSRRAIQLPTAILYQGIGPAISNTATGFRVRYTILTVDPVVPAMSGPLGMTSIPGSPIPDLWTHRRMTITCNQVLRLLTPERLRECLRPARRILTAEPGTMGRTSTPDAMKGGRNKTCLIQM